MSSLISKNNLVLGFILLCVFVVSIHTLTTKPGLWVDESKSILLSRSYANHGTLDIEVSPGNYSDVKPLLQSTGYAVTVPLGLLFSFFTESFVLARFYMLLWMISALFAIYFFVSKISNQSIALFATALVATFASFHDSGRTVVGEIPGFLFLIIGLYLYIHKRSDVWAGLFMSLSLVTKPSVYLSVIPALIVLALVSNSIWQDKLKSLGRLFVGSLAPALLWVHYSLELTSKSGVLEQITGFLSNPYGNSSHSNILTNIVAIPHTATIIYFAIFIILILFSYKKIQNLQARYLIIFTLVYSFFAFIYYLRSPGWLRYLVAADMLILICLPIALAYLNLRWRLGLWVIIAFQIYHFFNLAQIQYSDAALTIARDIRMTRADICFGACDRSVGLINAIDVASMLPDTPIFQVLEMDGIPRMGTNPLNNPNLSAKLPEVVVTAGDISRFGGEDTLSRAYNLKGINKGYKRYELK